MWDMYHDISQRLLANPNYACSHFPHIYWSSYEYLSHYESEVLVSLENDHIGPLNYYVDY